jgi:hypothetical protein
MFILSICSSTAEQNGYAYSTSHLTRLCSKNQEWSRIKDTERERLGLTLDHDGEFWYIALYCSVLQLLYVVKKV